MFLFSKQGGPGPRKGRAGEHSPWDQNRIAQPRLGPPKAACEAGRLFNSCSRLSTRHSRGRSLALRLRHVLVDRSAHEERVDLALARSQFSEISSNDAWSTDAQEVVAGIAAVELPGLGHADLKLLQTAPTGCARTDHPSRPASRRARPGPGIVQTKNPTIAWRYGDG